MSLADPRAPQRGEATGKIPLTPGRAGTFDALAHISSAPLTHSSDGRALRAGAPVDSVPLTLYVCHESLCVSASRSLLKPWVPGSVWELKQAPKTIPVHGQQEPGGKCSAHVFAVTNLGEP